MRIGISIYTIILAMAVCLVSCQNKELCFDDHYHLGIVVKVQLHWENSEVAGRPAGGMWLNIFSLDNNLPHYGQDIVANNDYKYIRLINNNSYLGLCYDNFNSKVYVRNAGNRDIEAFCASMSRSTYDSRVMQPAPGETTVAEPDVYYAAKYPEFKVQVPNDVRKDTLLMHFYPKNISDRFTFRINNIGKAVNIRGSRGAISGISPSYFIAEEKYSGRAATLLFGEERCEVTLMDNVNGYIEGYFYAFKRLEASNLFTVEIMSKGTQYANYYTHTWDVTGQMELAANLTNPHPRPLGYDIVIDNHEIPDIVIPDQGGDGGSGFTVDVDEWETETVEMNN